MPLHGANESRLLAGVDWLKYANMNNTIPFTKQHKMTRLDSAKRMIVQTGMRPQLVFSDEKKFNLDGPDGLSITGVICGSLQGNGPSAEWWWFEVVSSLPRSRSSRY